MNALFVFCIILCCCLLEVVVGFQFNTLQSRSSRLSTIRQLQASKKSPAAVGRCDALHMSMDPNELDDDVRAKIDKLVKNNKVVLFMKGNKLFPQW